MLAEGLPSSSACASACSRGAEIGEGDAGPHRISEIRRSLDPARPMRLRRGQAFGYGNRRGWCDRKCRGRTAALNSARVFSSAAGSSSSLPASSAMVGAPIGGNSVGMKLVDHGRIEDDIGDLVGLGCDQPAPDRVALGPDVLALVIEARGALVDDDAEHDRIMPRDDARRRISGGARASIATLAWHWVGSPISWTSLASSIFRTRAAIIGRAADQEIVGGTRPNIASAIRCWASKPPAAATSVRSAGGLMLAIVLQAGGQEHASLMSRSVTLGVVEDFHAQLLRGAVERVQHRPSAAEEE